MYSVLGSCWSLEKLKLLNNFEPLQVVLFPKQSRHCIRNSKPVIRPFQNLYLSVLVSRLKYFSQPFEVWPLLLKCGLLKASRMQAARCLHLMAPFVLHSGCAKKAEGKDKLKALLSVKRQSKLCKKRGFQREGGDQVFGNHVQGGEKGKQMHQTANR